MHFQADDSLSAQSQYAAEKVSVLEQIILWCLVGAAKLTVLITVYILAGEGISSQTPTTQKYVQFMFYIIISVPLNSYFKCSLVDNVVYE